jgi:hypothetical protein
VTGSFDEHRLAADLRRAAESYEPDSERIAELLRARTAPAQVAPAHRSGQEDRAGAGAGPSRVRRSRHPLRTTTWLAAAASVVLAVAAADLVLQREDRTAPTSGRPATAIGTTKTTAPGPARLAPSTGKGTVPGMITPQPTGAPAAARTTPAGSVRTVASGGSGAPTSGGSLGSDGSSSKIFGDREVSVTVSAVPSGSERQLGTGGRQWVASPSSLAGTPPHSQSLGWPIGPAQVMGSGATLDPSPFSVSWPDGVSGGPGRSTSWLTVPHDVRGAPAGLRVPLRYPTGSVTVTLLLGTSGGGGRLVLSLSDGSLTADLPGCAAAPCPAVVRITMRPAAGGILQAGDAIVDLSAAEADGRVGFAGAEMSG